MRAAPSFKRGDALSPRPGEASSPYEPLFLGELAPWAPSPDIAGPATSHSSRSWYSGRWRKGVDWSLSSVLASQASMDDSHATLPVPSWISRGEREAEPMYTGEAAQVSGLLSCTICFFPLGHRRRLRPRLPQAYPARQSLYIRSIHHWQYGDQERQVNNASVR